MLTFGLVSLSSLIRSFSICFSTSQSITAPNGLIAHMFGPIEGRRHDAFMLSISGLPCKLHPLVTVVYMIDL